MGGKSRERIIEGRQQDLLINMPEMVKNRGSRAGLDLIYTDDEIRMALLNLVINRRPEDWQKALDRINLLHQRVVDYKGFLDKEGSGPKS